MKNSKSFDESKINRDSKGRFASKFKQYAKNARDELKAQPKEPTPLDIINNAVKTAIKEDMGVKKLIEYSTKIWDENPSLHSQFKDKLDFIKKFKAKIDEVPETKESKAYRLEQEKRDSFDDLTNDKDRISYLSDDVDAKMSRKGTPPPDKKGFIGIYNYAGESFKLMNEALRNPGENIEKRTEWLIEATKQGLKQLPAMLPESMSSPIGWMKRSMRCMVERDNVCWEKDNGTFMGLTFDRVFDDRCFLDHGWFDRGFRCLVRQIPIVKKPLAVARG
ncbi:MAG: hypothetical protein ACRC78_02615 [Planktothrix sp.]